MSELVKLTQPRIERASLPFPHERGNDPGFIRAFADAFETAVSEMTVWDAEVVQWAKDRFSRLEGRQRYVVTDEELRALKLPYTAFPGPNPGNRLVTVGLGNMTSRLLTTAQQWTPTSGTPGSATGYTGLGVGNGTSPGDAIGDTNLVGASRSFRICDPGFPTRSNGQVTWKSTWQSTEANFDWNEYCSFVPNTTTSFTDAAHFTSKQSAWDLFSAKRPAGLGTKSSGNNASLTLTITIT